jgi:hypothetical protein
MTELLDLVSVRASLLVGFCTPTQRGNSENEKLTPKSQFYEQKTPKSQSVMRRFADDSRAMGAAQQNLAVLRENTAA